MKSYRIEFTDPASDDLVEIYDYIAKILREPRSAARIYRAIRRGIQSLATMPERFQVVYEPPYREMGVRKLFVENYTVFYIVGKDHVTVLRVLYNRREWQHILGFGMDAEE